MKSEIYKTIRDTVLARLPTVAYIDLYRGQDRNQQKTYPFPLPAVLVQFQNIRWTNQAARHQIGDCIINIRLITDTIYDTFEGSEAEETALNELLLLENLWDCIEGITGDGFSSLNRVNENYEAGNMQITFECAVFQKIENTTQTANPIINFTTEING